MAVATPKKPVARGAVASKATQKKSPKKAVSSLPSESILRIASQMFKHISDPTRLAIVTLLKESSKSVTQLCVELGNQSQPAVSHHLAILYHANIVTKNRSGKNIFYTLHNSAIAERIADLEGLAATTR